jgi:hypothetical protein
MSLSFPLNVGVRTMPDLFLSYSRKDSPTMGIIRDNLRMLGFNLWIDIEYLRPGTPQWERAVKRAVGKSDGMLVLCSPFAEKSDWVNREVHMARVADKPIIPVLIAGEEWESIPASLMGDQYCDMRGRSVAERSFRELVAALVERFGSDSPEYELHFSDDMHIPTVQAVQDADLRDFAEGRIFEIRNDTETMFSGALTVNFHSGEPAESPASPEPDAPIVDAILDILPVPFLWCGIPWGQVVVEGQVFEVNNFLMARYQTTYEQFQVFVDDPNGFTNSEWWEGLAAPASHQKAPGKQHFTHERNLPRENVSWYDSIAFCRWLSSRIGYEVRLPTEWEWQWAAQGPDERAYPWDDKYVKGYANVDEKDSGLRYSTDAEKTTPVGSYPLGASLFGVLDMSGNVWEWCLNEYDNPNRTGLADDTSRVLRGGSLHNSIHLARTDARSSSYPDSRKHNVGFRVVGFVPALP